MPQFPPSGSTDLQQAFESFSELSRELIDSYHQLEQRMSRLDARLRVSAPEPDATAREALGTARLRRVLEALPAGIIVIDAAGVITEHNPAATELLGAPLLGVAWRDVIARCFEVRADDGPDISLRDGRRAHLSTTPLGDEPGQIVLITDVTHTRALQDRLHHYERLSSLGDMASGLAHQLRTPLATALLYVGMLRSDKPGADRSALANKALTQLRHIEKLICDMLTLTRVDLTQGETLTGTELLTRLEPLITPLIPAPRIALQLVDESDAVQVRAHVELLLSALVNLVNNAVAAIDDTGTVSVRLCAADDELQISVTDTGRGMNEETRRRIGQPFFTTREGGTGLGVAVVNAVAKAHHGVMTFTSQEGRGSTFIVRLPALGRTAGR